MRAEFKFPEGTNRTDYFTGAAKWINSIEFGVELEDGRNLRVELDDYEQRELRDYIYGLLLKDIKSESRATSKRIGLNYDQEDEFNSILQEMVASEFYKYNNPSHMTNTEKRYAIGTFIGQISPRAMRVYLSEDMNLPVNVIRNLRRINKAINDIAKDKKLSRYSVTPEMVAEKLNDLSISVRMIIDLMNLSQGNISLNTMLEENDERLVELAKEDESHFSNLDEKTKKILDDTFDKLSKADMCLLMKQYGFFGDEVQKLQIADFVGTELFQKLLLEDSSVRSKKNLVKTAYNKLAKISTELFKLASDLKECEFEGELESYCHSRWQNMIQ